MRDRRRISARGALCARGTLSGMMRGGDVGLAAMLAASCTTGNPVFMVDSDSAGSVTGATAGSMTGGTDVTGMTGGTGMTGMAGTGGVTGEDSTGMVSATVDATSAAGTTSDGDITTSGSTGPAPLCGNGVINEGETCDDGNVKGGDNCEANCLALFADPTYFEFDLGFYWDLEAGDFNNDGHMDLVAARHDDPSGAPVLLNKGDGTFAQGGLFPLPASPVTLHAFALAGDNGDDLVAGPLEGQDVFVKHQVGGDDYDGGLEFVNVMAGIPASVQIGHVDGDSWIDVVVPAPVESAVAVARGKEDGFFEVPTYHKVGAPVLAFELAQLDQGTSVDLVGVFNNDDTSYFVVTYNFYQGPPIKTILVEDPVGRFSAVTVADVGEQDGVPEIVFTDAGFDRVRVFEQTVGEPVETVTIAVETAPNEIAAVALRGQGSPDLITRNGLSGTVSVIATFDGFQVMDPIVGLVAGVPIVGMAIADFDGDELPDLAVLAPGGQVAVHINQTGE